MPQDTALTVYGEYQASISPIMNNAILDLEDKIRMAAQANLDAALVQVGGGFTETEQLAMLVVEELKQVNGLDLAAVLLRAKYINEIQRRNLLAAHPQQYTSMQEMANMQGISATELSMTMAMVDHIFPFIQERLGIPVAQLWEEIGKSKMRELVPVLLSIITGAPSDTASVRHSVDNILDDVAATNRAAGRELSEGQLQMAAVAELLQHGATLNVRQLRQQIRPQRTAPISTSVMQVGNQRVLVMNVEDQGQWDTFMRRFGENVDLHPVNLPADPVQRQQEAARIPELRALMRLLEG